MQLTDRTRNASSVLRLLAFMLALGLTMWRNSLLAQLAPPKIEPSEGPSPNYESAAPKPLPRAFVPPSIVPPTRSDDRSSEGMSQSPGAEGNDQKHPQVLSKPKK
jgi:hypothetical protein